MSRCTSATASNASSMTASTSDRDAGVAVISTKVPSSGRARRTLSQVGYNGQNPFHAFGHVMGRQGRAGDVADILANLKRAGTGFSNKLSQPTRVPDLTTIGFTVLQNIDATHATAGIKCHDVVDIEVLADHVVKDEEADDLAASLGLPDAAGLQLGEASGRREGKLLGFADGEILHRVSRRGHRHGEGRRRGPPYPLAHRESSVAQTRPLTAGTSHAKALTCSLAESNPDFARQQALGPDVEAIKRSFRRRLE